MFLDSIVVFKLVFSQHFVQDAVEIVAIIGGKDSFPFIVADHGSANA
jgi:hypothetical protein